MSVANPDSESGEIAARWCSARGEGWRVDDVAGRGGTATVFSITSPDGQLALKLYEESFSQGERGAESQKRIALQLTLKDHSCPHLVRIYDGGLFENRLFVLMDRAAGTELETRLAEIPRTKIRQIVSQVATACIYLRSIGLSHRDIKSSNIFVSDDYERATLLDLSVIRDIRDPYGLGTDHGGQLPVVATSRYSPPEYLFRLIEPSAELWHALDVYQLGGLLHDLITREPLFEGEYKRSRENRYRFAWIVATVDPVVEASDVDHDLVFLARRALDKNWGRRKELRLEDFLDTASNKRSVGLAALGLTVRKQERPIARATANQRIERVASEIKSGMVAHLKSLGVTTSHNVSTIHGNDLARSIALRWNTISPDTKSPQPSTITITLVFAIGASGANWAVSTGLETLIDGVQKSSAIDLPAFVDNEEAVSQIVANCGAALGELAAKIMESV